MQINLTATRLRAELFSTLDRVAETGETVEVRRPGGTVLIVRDHSASRLSALKQHPGTIIGNPDELASLSWGHEWKPLL